jgi:hypothetical protein
MNGHTQLRLYTAEFLGTFLLVFAGPGAVVINAVSGGNVTSLGIGLSFGLAVMAAIYAIGHISGAHINPAVTLACAMTRHFPWSQVPGYLAAQLLSARREYSLRRTQSSPKSWLLSLGIQSGFPSSSLTDSICSHSREASLLPFASLLSASLMLLADTSQMR